MDLIKWQLNFGSCNFGRTLYLWIQIELALRARSILKSRVCFQTKLHSTQFNYHYKPNLIKLVWQDKGRLYFKIPRKKLKSKNICYALRDVGRGGSVIFYRTQYPLVRLFFK